MKHTRIIHSIRRAVLLALVAALCPLWTSATVLAQAPPDQERPDPAQKYGPEANPGQVFKETRGKSDLHAQGLEVSELRGRAAGKPISAMPGAKAITGERWKEMKEIPKTGLFLVNLDHVPPGLQEDLEKNGYELDPDGTLTRNGNPVALFVVGETFRVKPNKPAGPPDGAGDGDRPTGSAGLADRAGRAVFKALDSGLSLLTADAEAASPFPWRCVSWYFNWQYDGGFCREYRAWSHAYAWSSSADGTCADPKPLTRIEYVSTYINNSGRTDWDYHYNADQSHSYAEWDIGCFWPAHGGGSGYHYAYWRDGSASMYRTWSW